MEDKERRLETRFLCADLVRVDWVDGAGRTRTVEAVLEDISPAGACVQVEEEIPLGVPVAISAHGTIFTGCISYCAFRDYGYFAGVKLSEEHRWSRGEFEPRHLTNLRELAEAEAEQAPMVHAKSDSSTTGAPAESSPSRITRP